MSEDLAHTNYAPEARPPAGMEALPWIDLSPLSPYEVLALQRYARSGDAEDPELLEKIRVVFGCGAPLNPERYKDLCTARAESPLPADRLDFVESENIYELAKVNRDAGTKIFDRLARDRDESVRAEVRERLREALLDAGTKAGWNDPDPYLFADVDEDVLQAHTGFTLDDVDKFLLAYAQAHHGVGIYDPGLEALRTLEPHRQPSNIHGSPS